jgi:AcrR family transcriptional regulator
LQKLSETLMTKSEKTRQLIIEKAAILFNQKGYEGTSMSDIMEATGLTKGGIYGNFKREGLDKKGVKEEIAIAAFEHAVSTVYEEIGRRTGVIDNTLDKLKAVVYFYKERIFNPPVKGGCPIQNTAVEADDTNPALRERVVQAIEMWKKRIVRTLEKGVEKGEVHPGVDLEEFATLFIGTLEGGIMLARIQRRMEPFEVMAKQLITHIEELRP